MRLIFPLFFGLVGCAVLLALGVWQLQRLAWKEAIIADAAAMIAADPVPLPANPDPATDRYRAVTVSGTFTGQETHVLTSTREEGPGYLVIAVLDTGDRRLLIDRGFVPEAQIDTPRPPQPATVIGNLNWPDDVTAGTPPYDAARGIWFGRDVPGMAALLDTQPLLIIARSDTGQGIRPAPVTTAGFRNDHLGYALTWFGLAAVWAGMTLLFVWRIRRRAA